MYRKRTMSRPMECLKGLISSILRPGIEYVVECVSNFNTNHDMFIRIMLGLFLCAILWAMTQYPLGSYFDRAHSGGCRIYRVNSYEQFMKAHTGNRTFMMA